jgi:hypothetical protein
MTVISRENLTKSLIAGIIVFLLFAVLIYITDGYTDVEIPFKFASAFFAGMLLYYAIRNLNKNGKYLEVKLIVFGLITLMLVNDLQRLFTFFGIIILASWIVALADLIYFVTRKRVRS